MKRKALVVSSLLLAVIFIFAACKPKPKATLKLDKNQVNVGEVFTVTYTAPETFEKSAWIGVIPSNITHGSESANDQHDVSYKYLNKSTSGQMNFTAPMQPGKYDLRMHDTDNNGKEVAYVSFTVIGSSPVSSPSPEAPPAAAPAQAAEPAGTAAAGSKFNVGDAVKVEWKGSWWPARVIAVGKNSWKIHYDGYSSSWDEWVGPARIKSP